MLAEELKQNKKVFYSIIDQLIRASTSIRSNIIEAKFSYSKKGLYKIFK